MQQIRNLYRALGRKLTLGDYAVLEACSPDGACAGEIADDLEVVPATISNILGKLIILGYVHKESVAGDRRKSRVILNVKGKDALRNLHDALE